MTIIIAAFLPIFLFAARGFSTKGLGYAFGCPLLRSPGQIVELALSFLGFHSFSLQPIVFECNPPLGFAEPLLSSLVKPTDVALPAFDG